jgi:hypothetical protein
VNGNELKTGFTRLTDPIVPVPDPYGRLLRRARRHRVTAWASTLAAGVIVALTASLVASAPAAPHPGPSIDPRLNKGAVITPWVQRLLDSPIRGNLAGDTAFVDALTGRLNPTDIDASPELSDVTVLFAGDIPAAGYRAVLVAFTSATRQTGLWMVGGLGAGADQFLHAARRASAAGPTVVPDVMPADLSPFSATADSEPDAGHYLTIGVAPAGCQVATSTDGHTWTGTGDWAFSTDEVLPTKQPLARVTCDGVRRYEGVLLIGATMNIRITGVTDAQLDAALAGVRGTPPNRPVARAMLDELVRDVGTPTGCRVLYNGPVAGQAPLLVTACPTASDQGRTKIGVAATNSTAQQGFSVTSAEDQAALTDPQAIFACPAPTDPVSDRPLVVIAPATATHLRVSRPGHAPTTTPLTNGVGTLPPNPAGSTVDALDAGGNVVGSHGGPLVLADPTGQVPSVSVQNWN